MTKNGREHRSLPSSSMHFSTAKSRILPLATEDAIKCECGWNLGGGASLTVAQGSSQSHAGNDDGLETWDVHDTGCDEVVLGIFGRF